VSAKSHEHRMRVLENLTKVAAEQTAPAQQRRDPQLKIPLIGEVKRGRAQKPSSGRARRKSDTDQPDLGEL
jgi:hypothetical protein